MFDLEDVLYKISLDLKGHNIPRKALCIKLCFFRMTDSLITYFLYTVGTCYFRCNVLDKGNI